VLTISGAADVATYETVLQSVTYSDTASSATIAPRTISVVVNDGTVDSVAATTTMTLVKGVPPSGYSITADKSAFNATTKTSAGFTFAGATVGTKYTYTVSSATEGTAINGSGTVTSATQDVAPIDVSSLPDGTLTFSVTLANAAGVVGQAATATAKLDTAIPTGYTITADQSTLDASSVSSASFTFADAEVGTTYSYSVRSSGDGDSTSVTGRGTVTSATQQVTGIDLKSLSDGTLTYNVQLTDTAGNTGAISAAFATLKRTT
jgi:large repetitive protein